MQGLCSKDMLLETPGWRSRLVLFDIDFTLTVGPIGQKNAFCEAIKRVLNIDTNMEIISFIGKTDQLILIELLQKNGVNNKIIRLKLGLCMETLARIFQENMENGEIIILDGVKELLEELDKHGVIIGLLTGNLEPIARAKMQKVGLDSYFKIGGFGSDNKKRSSLIKVAIKRAKKLFGFEFDDNVIVIGDTPHDIEAGKEAHVRTVGVATSFFSKEQLREAGADIVVDSLLKMDEVLSIVLAT